MNICIFGGTFDPPHIGHQQILNQLMLCNFDLILVVPTGDVNYKRVSTDKFHRLNMVNAWIDTVSDERVMVDDFEVNYCDYSNTYRTICYLLEKYPDAKLNMAIGFDSYQDLANWDESEFLLSNVNFIVFDRDGSNEFISGISPISSTSLRNYFDPSKVIVPCLNYIVNHQLYDLQPYIVDYERVRPQINCIQEINSRVNYIKQTLLSAHKTSLVLGISGGQDSTLCAKLAAIAIDQLNSTKKLVDQQPYRLHLMTLCYGNQQGQEDIDLVEAFVQTPISRKITITDSVDHICYGSEFSDFNKGNIKARMRMIIQYAIAGECNGLVLGTDHSSENVVGFFTKYGDGGADLNPLFGLNKRQGRYLLKSLGCPSTLYEKTPTADLLDHQPMKPDEEELGVTYDQIDDYLEGNKVSQDAKIKIEQLFVTSMHKRSTNNYK